MEVLGLHNDTFNCWRYAKICTRKLVDSEIMKYGELSQKRHVIAESLGLFATTQSPREPRGIRQSATPLGAQSKTFMQALASAHAAN